MPQEKEILTEKVGLPYWIDQVLDKHSEAGGALPAEPIHDLRVSLRRCILIADVMMDLDPGSDWKAMRKSARRTFHRFGALRDTQVLMEWIEKLGDPSESSTGALLEILKKKQDQERSEAREAIREFDRKQWRSWRRAFAKRYRSVVTDRPTCDSLLLEILENARDLNRRAQRSRSLQAYHRLRVGLKKFRYAVENFLPALYSVWESDLKFVQDVLGEVHDLTVLDQFLLKNQALFEEPALAAWRKKVDEARSSRLQEYRAKMAGKSSLFRTWREVLPAEKDLRSSGLARLAKWASFLTPNFPRVRRTARLSLQLYDGIANCGLTAKETLIEERFILHAAALLQDVVRFHRHKAYHKESYGMIRELSPPPGWTDKDLQFVALIARFHRGALPYPDHEKLRGYELPLRESLVRLAGVLRMAGAFQGKATRAVRRLQVENGPGFLVIRAEGLRSQDPLGPKLSDARRFLEFACQRSVHILAPGTHIMIPRAVKPATRSDAA